MIFIINQFQKRFHQKIKQLQMKESTIGRIKISSSNAVDIDVNAWF